MTKNLRSLTVAAPMRLQSRDREEAVGAIGLGIP